MKSFKRPDWLDGIKVAVMVSTLARGGAERATLQLAGGLWRRGVNTELVTVLSTDNTYLPEALPGLPVRQLHARRQRFIPAAFRRYVDSERPDVIVSSLLNNWTVFSRFFCRHKPKLVISQRTTLSAALSGRQSLLGSLSFYASRMLYPRAERIVAVSHAVAEDLAALRLAPAERLRVIYNPVVTEGFLAAREGERTEPYLAAGRLNFVAVGNLKWEKDYGTLLRAFAAVRERHPAHLVIFGEGPLRGELESLAVQLGIADDVQMPGFTLNPFPYVTGADCLVSSSVVEGLPGVVIQALACGTNVVATDCPGGSAEILGGGRYGRLVPVGDPAAMAAALLKAVQEPLDKEFLLERGRDFSEDRCVDSYIELIGELVEV